MHLSLLYPSLGFTLRASLWLFKFTPDKFVGFADAWVSPCLQGCIFERYNPDLLRLIRTEIPESTLGLDSGFTGGASNSADELHRQISASGLQY